MAYIKADSLYYEKLDNRGIEDLTISSVSVFKDTIYVAGDKGLFYMAARDLLKE